MTSEVSHGLLFSRNQTLKSAHVQYIIILKNKFKILKKKTKKKLYCGWVMEHVVIFVGIQMQLQTVLCYIYTYDMIL